MDDDDTYDCYECGYPMCEVCIECHVCDGDCGEED